MLNIDIFELKVDSKKENNFVWRTRIENSLKKNFLKASSKRQFDKNSRNIVYVSIL